MLSYLLLLEQLIAVYTEKHILVLSEKETYMFNGAGSKAVAAEQTGEKGWIQTITEYLNFDSFLSKFNLSTAIVLETLGFGAAGFLAGLLVKRYAQQVIIGIILFFLLLKGFEYFGVGSMSLNWARVKELTGITPDATFGSICSSLMTWLQQHVRQAIAIVVGFVAGLKLA